MKNLFSYDGYVMRILTSIMYIVSLNLLVLVVGMPIITLGAGFVAMNSVLFQYLKGEEPEIIKAFMKAFQKNFKRATLIWGSLLMIAFSLVLNYRFLAEHQLNGEFFLYIFLSSVGVLWTAWMVYAFPIMAFFDDNRKGDAGFIIGLAIAKLHYTAALLVLHIVPTLILLYMAQYFQIAVIVLICSGISHPAYWSCKILLHLFTKELTDAGE